MNESATVCLSTLGSQPQVVTLTLDLLLAQSIAINEMIVTHLSTHNPRYRAAVERLDREFANNLYRGHTCRYQRIAMRVGNQVITDLNHPHTVEATLDTYHTLIQRLKMQGATIHLCLSGGRRLLGILALSAALLYFDHSDRIWHLYSSDLVRQHTDQGKVMHMPHHPDINLVPVSIPCWGHMFPILRSSSNSFSSTVDRQTNVLDASEHATCKQVYEKLTPRQREVLLAFAEGLAPQEVADRLGVTLETINAHKTTIFQECRNAWNLPDELRLNYHWLHKKFGSFST